MKFNNAFINNPSSCTLWCYVGQNVVSRYTDYSNVFRNLTFLYERLSFFTTATVLPFRPFKYKACISRCTVIPLPKDWFFSWWLLFLIEVSTVQWRVMDHLLQINTKIFQHRSWDCCPWSQIFTNMPVLVTASSSSCRLYMMYWVGLINWSFHVLINWSRHLRIYGHYLLHSSDNCQ